MCLVPWFLHLVPLFFVGATQRSPGFGGNRHCVPDSHWMITHAETAFGLLLLPGHSANNRLKQTLSFSVKEAYSLIFEPY